MCFTSLFHFTLIQPNTIRVFLTPVAFQIQSINWGYNSGLKRQSQCLKMHHGSFGTLKGKRPWKTREGADLQEPERPTGRCWWVACKLVLSQAVPLDLCAPTVRHTLSWSGPPGRVAAASMTQENCPTSPERCADSKSVCCATQSCTAEECGTWHQCWPRPTPCFSLFHLP